MGLGSQSGFGRLDDRHRSCNLAVASTASLRGTRTDKVNRELIAAESDHASNRGARPRAVAVFSLLLMALALFVFLPAAASAQTTGDFRVQNYATGTGNGNFFWRGYLFRPSREVVVRGMWGGSGPNCTQFAGAILEAELTGI